MQFKLGLDGSDRRGTRTQVHIENLLQTIFLQWQAAPAYAYYLLDLPGQDLNVVDDNVGNIGHLQQNVIAWRPYPSVLSPGAVIQLNAPAPMQTLPPRDQICVVLDSLGVKVPVLIANIVSASFVVGLVTRLMLRKFGDRSTGDYINELNVIARTPLDFVTGYGNTDQTFQAQFPVVAQRNSVQPSGLFLGWNAGGKLDTAPSQVQAAIWQLLHLRFGWQDLGELTAYGLSYCDGFAHVQSALRAAGTLVGQGQQATPAAVLTLMQNDTTISELEQTIVQFFNALTKSFVTAARTTNNLQAVVNYSNYVQGYQQGSIRAASDIFNLTLSVGYGLGYADGFRVGYARGYSDGYKAGYQDGQAINWGNVLSDIATVVDDAYQVVALFA